MKSCFTVNSQDWKSEFKKYIKTVGGWPLLEGKAWKEIPWWKMVSNSLSNSIFSVVTSTFLEAGTIQPLCFYMILNVSLFLIKGTALYSGLLLAPVEGFGLWLRLFLPFWQKSELFGCFCLF